MKHNRQCFSITTSNLCCIIDFDCLKQSIKADVMLTLLRCVQRMSLKTLQNSSLRASPSP